MPEMLLHYFSKMGTLSTECLSICGAEVLWQPRPTPIGHAEEWVQLMTVADPAEPSNASGVAGPAGPGASPRGGATHSLTPPSIPPALAVLYLAELGLAKKALQRGAWGELWRPAAPAALGSPPLPRRRDPCTSSRSSGS